MTAAPQRMPKALPDLVVCQIWHEILGNEFDKAAMGLIVGGMLRPEKDLQLSFVQAAMEYPHFANALELARAIYITPGVAAKLMDTVKRKARKERV